MATVRVTEIFRSIQGESTRAGMPCAFIRLTGCALRCVWCDSEYAFTGGEEMEVEEAARRVLALETELVEITGGEPLEQEGTHPLIERLLAAGTNGPARDGRPRSDRRASIRGSSRSWT